MKKIAKALLVLLGLVVVTLILDTALHLWGWRILRRRDDRTTRPYVALLSYVWVSFGRGVVVDGFRGRGVRRR